MVTTSEAIDRFSAPLYTVAEAARYLDVPDSTIRSWVHGYRRARDGGREVRGRPVLTSLAADRGARGAAIPFVGLAEGLVLTAMRRSHVPLQRIRPALERLQQEFGLGHALASRRLYTDGAEVLFDYAKHGADADAAQAVRELVVVRNGQRVFNEVVEDYLRLVRFAPDGTRT
jgi:excisionase family DNA binding protein